MQTKEKIAELNKLLISAIHIRRSWRGKKTLDSNVDYLCEKCIELVVAILRFDKNILAHVFIQLDTDYSQFDFNDFVKLDKFKPKERMEPLMLWDKMLKTFGLIKDTNNFTKWFPKWISSRNLESFKIKPTDSAQADVFFDWTDEIVKEIVYALSDWFFSYEREDPAYNQSTQLATLLWLLDEIRWIFLNETEVSGPYILYAGKDWGVGLDDSSVDGHFGILSVNPLSVNLHSLNPHSAKPLFSRDPKNEVKCNFKSRVGDKLLTLSWVMPESFNSERLFQTWFYDSGAYCEYPDTELKAYWPLSWHSEVHYWCEGLYHATLPILEKSQRYCKIAKRVRETLKLHDLAWPGVLQFKWTTIQELDVLILDIKSEMLEGDPEMLEALDEAHGVSEHRRRAKPNLNDAEQNIIEALGTKKLIGEELAKKAGYPYNSNFKSTLARLRIRMILGNEFPKGYFIRPEYNFLVAKSD